MPSVASPSGIFSRSKTEKIRTMKAASWFAGKIVVGLLVFRVIRQSLSMTTAKSSESLLIQPYTVIGNGGGKTEGRTLMQQSFVNCSVIKQYASGSPSRKILSNMKNQKPCALLFFGLAKQFRKVVLPSIRKNILNISDNAGCDIYLHNYNLTKTTSGRNGEFDSVLQPDEVYDLTQNVVWDTMEEFNSKRNMTDLVNPTTKPPFWDWNSLRNMYKQWHSIERVWDLMEEQANRRGIEYKQVGLFRTDVKYVTPIDIFDGDAVIPKFGFLINDRLFYGTYENAHVWAKIRFASVPCYKPRHKSIGMHSEFFMNDLVLKNIPQVSKRDICFYRVRANGKVWDKDCTRSYKYPRYLKRLKLLYHV